MSVVPELISEYAQSSFSRSENAKDLEYDLWNAQMSEFQSCLVLPNLS